MNGVGNDSLYNEAYGPRPSRRPLKRLTTPISGTQQTHHSGVVEGIGHHLTDIKCAAYVARDRTCSRPIVGCLDGWMHRDDHTRFGPDGHEAQPLVSGALITDELTEAPPPMNRRIVTCPSCGETCAEVPAIKAHLLNRGSGIRADWIIPTMIGLSPAAWPVGVVTLDRKIAVVHPVARPVKGAATHALHGPRCTRRFDDIPDLLRGGLTVPEVAARLGISETLCRRIASQVAAAS